MHEGDNPLFLNEFMKFIFLLDNFIHIRIFKQIPKYLAKRGATDFVMYCYNQIELFIIR